MERWKRMGCQGQKQMDWRIGYASIQVQPLSAGPFVSVPQYEAIVCRDDVVIGLVPAVKDLRKVDRPLVQNAQMVEYIDWQCRQGLVKNRIIAAGFWEQGGVCWWINDCDSFRFVVTLDRRRGQNRVEWAYMPMEDDVALVVPWAKARAMFYCRVRPGEENWGLTKVDMQQWKRYVNALGRTEMMAIEFHAKAQKVSAQGDRVKEWNEKLFPKSYRLKQQNKTTRTEMAKTIIETEFAAQSHLKSSLWRWLMAVSRFVDLGARPLGEEGGPADKLALNDRAQYAWINDGWAVRERAWYVARQVLEGK